MGFQTAYRPRPIFNERPPMPVVPIERVRPIVSPPVQTVEEAPAPAPVVASKPLLVDPADLGRWEQAASAPAFSSSKVANDIITRIAFAHGLTADDILGRSAAKKAVEARQEAMAVIYTALPHWSFPKIGKLFGRDHTTVLNAVKKMGAWRQ